MAAFLTRLGLIKLCTLRGVLLLDQGDCLSIDAPPGQVFKGSGNHSHTIRRDGWVMRDLYAELAEDIGGGCEPCPDGAECDTCATPMTFDELHKLYGGDRLA